MAETEHSVSAIIVAAFYTHHRNVFIWNTNGVAPITQKGDNMLRIDSKKQLGKCG
jgi:hypothetical protein